ncbi:MAG: ArsR/SmtB family transcription factor [Spirochaetota bacterium]
MNTVSLLKALADETRLRIVSLVLHGGELCACEVEAILGVRQSNASRHLGRLVQAGLLASEKKGQWVHYSSGPLGDPAMRFVHDAVASARRESGVFERDLDRLADYRNSGFSCRTIRAWKPRGDGKRVQKAKTPSHSA